MVGRKTEGRRSKSKRKSGGKHIFLSVLVSSEDIACFSCSQFVYNEMYNFHGIKLALFLVILFLLLWFIII